MTNKNKYISFFSKIKTKISQNKKTCLILGIGALIFGLFSGAFIAIIEELKIVLAIMQENYNTLHKIESNIPDMLRYYYADLGFKGTISLIFETIKNNPKEITLNSAFIIIGVFAVKGAIGGALKGLVVGTLEGRKIFQKAIAIRATLGGIIGSLTGFLLFGNVEACAIGTILGAIIGVRTIKSSTKIKKIIQKYTLKHKKGNLPKHHNLRCGVFS